MGLLGGLRPEAPRQEDPIGQVGVPCTPSHGRDRARAALPVCRASATGSAFVALVQPEPRRVSENRAPLRQEPEGDGKVPQVARPGPLRAVGTLAVQPRGCLGALAPSQECWGHGVVSRTEGCTPCHLPGPGLQLWAGSLASLPASVA